MSDVDFKDNEAKSISQGSRGGDTLAQIFWPNTEIRDPELDDLYALRTNREKEFSDAHVFTAKGVDALSHQDIPLLTSLLSVGYH
tara:strand:+ start:1243 stop:1497 length:255 start_codon:yes stop_codon:yes gene_type:complete